MDAATVSLALEHWDALNLATSDSLKGRGVDGKFYPNYRHVLAWDIDMAIARLSPRYRAAANHIRYGTGAIGRYTREQTCLQIADELSEVVYEF